jgi:hypothetical protein
MSGATLMPFDTTKLRQPTVTVLPPTPLERDGAHTNWHLVGEAGKP